MLCRIQQIRAGVCCGINLNKQDICMHLLRYNYIISLEVQCFADGQALLYA